MLRSLSLIKKFLRNVFNDHNFEKLLSHGALVFESVAVIGNNQMQLCKEL